MLPQAFTTSFFLQNRLKKGVSELLYLVDQKGKHHQYGKVDGEVLFAMPVVMFKMIALIFEGVEGFIFNLPTRPSTFHYDADIPFFQGEIGNPAKMAYFVAVDFPVFQKVNQYILIALVQGNLIDKPIAMNGISFSLFIHSCFVRFMRGVYIIEQTGVIALFDTQYKTKISRFECFDRFGYAHYKCAGHWNSAHLR